MAKKGDKKNKIAENKAEKPKKAENNAKKPTKKVFSDIMTEIAENDEELLEGNSAEDFKLNERQKRFCEYYVKSQSAGKSYYQAYATDMGKVIGMDSAYTNGAKLLKSDKIKSYLNLLRKETVKKHNLEVEDLITELESIVTETHTKVSDKLKAIELLGKYHGGIWQERMSVDQNSTIEINLNGIETIPMNVIESTPTYLLTDNNED